MSEKSHYTSSKAFVAGLAAGSIAIGVALLLRSFIGFPFIPELASQTLFSITPGAIESQAVENFGPLAKYSAFIASIVINFVLYGIFGIIAEKFHNRFHWKGSIAKALQSSLVAYIIMLIISILLSTIIHVRTGGSTTSVSVTAVSLILPQILFGFIYSVILSGIKPILGKQVGPTLDNIRKDNSRIEFLRLVTVSTIAIPILYFGLNRLFSGQQQEQEQGSSAPTTQFISPARSRPVGFEDPMLTTLLNSELTPTYLFYRIDINPIVPIVDEKTWSLSVKGLVDNPLTISYEELKKMPSVEQYATLECVSNKIGGDLISTALWKGVRLKEILDRAIVKEGAKYIAFRCSDGYDVGIPLDRGLMDGTMLAYDMNLSPLTTKHGFPVRAIVPGLYGMMNPKWITEIELVDGVYEGYWQRNGWTNDADIHTVSTIVIPGMAQLRDRFRKLDETPNVIPGQKAPIAGIAFGGDRGISKVEVSTDGGVTWKAALIKEPLSKYTWVLWTAGLVPANKTTYKIIVRATDKTGQIQTAEVKDPFPDGATGYQSVSV
jgi:DMSO/TMAO reductase YedYZ molybdopterin-dependent catalytic subunit